MNFRLPVRPADNGHLGLGAEDLLALFIEQGGFTADLQVAARAGALGQLNELLGVLRRVEEAAELFHLLAGHDRVSVALNGFGPLSERYLYGGQPAFPLGLVFLVCFLASASAALAVMPNTANVLMVISEQAFAFARVAGFFKVRYWCTTVSQIY